MQLIDKDKVEEILRNLWKEDDGHNPEHRICYNKALQEVQCEIDTLDVREVDLEKENIIGTLERAVKIDAGGYPYINCDIEFYDYDKDIPLAKEGDIVKVVLIKGE